MPAHKKPIETARSETVTVRLDPKLYFLCGIAAREQIRTRSSFIEWAVRRTLADAAAMQNEPSPGQWPAPQPKLWGESLWDVDEADRFFKLATDPIYRVPLTIPEQRLWKLYTLWRNEKKPTVDSFREFWNNPSINTKHLQESGE